MTTVAVPQLDVADLDPAANLARIERRLAALPGRVEVALFPEYALTGFVPDDRLAAVAIPRDGPELDRVRDLASEHDLAILVGFAEAADGERYNATAYVRPGGDTAVYRKRNLWDDEREVVVAGTDRVVLDTPVGRTALLTCYDLNDVTESAALARERVDALFVGGMWPATASENWRLLLRARALDGVRWVVGAGRTGRRSVADAGPAAYAGRSAVVRPDGTVAAALGRDRRDLVADLDPAVLEEQRRRIRVLDE